MKKIVIDFDETRWQDGLHVCHIISTAYPFLAVLKLAISHGLHYYFAAHVLNASVM